MNGLNGWGVGGSWLKCVCVLCVCCVCVCVCVCYPSTKLLPVPLLTSAPPYPPWVMCLQAATTDICPPLPPPPGG